MNLSVKLSVQKLIQCELTERVKTTEVIKSKANIYNNLLGLSQNNQMKCINEVNEVLGYDYLSIHELKRHELRTNNSKIASKEVVEQQKEVYNATKEFYRQQYRELQKGYMKMLANLHT